MNKRKVFVLLAFIGVIGLNFFLESQMEQRQRKRAISIYANNATGISLFHKLLADTKPSPPRIIRRNLVEAKKIDSDLFLFVTSPEKPYSKTNTSVIKDFVSRGGTLFVSVESIKKLKNLRSLFTAFQIPHVEQNLYFENKKTSPIPIKKSQFIFESGDTLRSYSALNFSLPGCQNEQSLRCFYFKKTVSKGQLHVFLGVPFFSNAMIEKGDNFLFTRRLVDFIEKAAFEEYAHFYTDKTVTDFIFLPAFFFPTLLLIALLLAYFIFSQKEDRFSEESLIIPKRRKTGVHAFYLGVYQRYLKKDQGLIDKHYFLLKKLFPNSTDELTKIFSKSKGPNSLRKNLIQFHQNKIAKGK